MSKLTCYCFSVCFVYFLEGRERGTGKVIEFEISLAGNLVMSGWVSAVGQSGWGSSGAGSWVVGPGQVLWSRASLTVC